MPESATAEDILHQTCADLEPEWSELWADLLELSKAAITDRDNHYLVALVLQPAGQRAEMNIIDGQQRLVTLSLLALALISRLPRFARQGKYKERSCLTC